MSRRGGRISIDKPSRLKPVIRGFSRQMMTLNCGGGISEVKYEFTPTTAKTRTEETAMTVKAAHRG
jgi:hypothetical protein